jgi:glycosyltransferase involved in cell wall biosynthesis
MRIAFYAPLKPPGHATPSGDRRVAILFIEALRRAGHEVELASDFRSLDMAGDRARQAELRATGTAIARQLAARWLSEPQTRRPQLWFTYHVYYKAPDWLGPETSAALGVPYVIAEASYASKRAAGPWALGHEAARTAITRADLVLAASRHDLAGLRPLVPSPGQLIQLPPFLDALPFEEASRRREVHRRRLAAAHGLDPGRPWIIVAAMMRPGDKLASYRELAAALALLVDLPWQLLVAGDGPARREVAAALQGAAGERVCFLGELGESDLAQVYAAGDLFAWPAVNEAYGMAMLEAQAAGLPVVSCRVRGVPDVVCDGESGLLVEPEDPAALAGGVRAVLLDPARRAALGREALSWVRRERSLDAAARRLDTALARLATHAGTH